MSEEAQEAKQEPQKPKKSGGGGDLNIKKILMVVGGVMAAQVIIIIVLFQTVLAPAPPETAEGDENEHGDKHGKTHTTQGENGDTEEEDVFEDELEYIRMERPFNVTDKDWQYYISLHLGFRVKMKEAEHAEEEESGGHGAAPAPSSNYVDKNLSAQIKSKMTAYFRTMSVREIKSVQDSLGFKIKKKLYKLFKKNNMILHEVGLESFIISKVPD